MVRDQGSQPQLKELKAEFGKEVSCLMHPSSVEGTKVLNYLQRIGRQLNIRNFSVHDVVSEATMRGFDSIDRKEERIRSASAWLRSIGTRIIKDQVKREVRDRKLREKHAYHSPTPDGLLRLLVHEESAAISQAMQLLSLEDQKILRLRFIQGMRYKDIQAWYFDEMGVSVKEATLRKRESRALTRLKSKFGEMY
ncbi:MAG: RNA polymerase sigma factor [Phormidesmis sp.]